MMSNYHEKSKVPRPYSRQTQASQPKDPGSADFAIQAKNESEYPVIRRSSMLENINRSFQSDPAQFLASSRQVGSIQPKLTVAPQADPSEQEADQVASQVVPQINSSQAQTPQTINRKPEINSPPKITPSGKEKLQRKMDFKLQDLEGSLSVKAKVSNFFGKLTTFTKIQKLLQQYFKPLNSQQEEAILRQLKDLANHWLAHHNIPKLTPKTPNDFRKAQSLTKMIVAIDKELAVIQKVNEHSEKIPTSTFTKTVEPPAPKEPEEIVEPPAPKSADWENPAKLPTTKPTDLEALNKSNEYLDDIDKGKFGYGTSYLKNINQILSNDRMIDKDYGNQHRLTKGEMGAIHIYTGPDYEYINPVLAGSEAWLAGKVNELLKGEWSHIKKKGKESLKDFTKEEREQLKTEVTRHTDMAVAGLNKLPDVTMLSYRGLRLTSEEFKTQYEDKINQVATFPAFISTSQNRGVAETFAQPKGAGDGKIGILLVMEVTKGKDIARLSFMKTETEVLVLPNAQFTIDSIKDLPSGVKEVHLTQIA